MITDSNEYINFLKDIQDSGTLTYSTLPVNESRFFIDANKRSVSIPLEFPFLAVRYDHCSETVYFEIDRYFDSVDLSQHTCIVQFKNKDKLGNVSEGYYLVPIMDITSIEGKIIFGWSIENAATKYAGDIEFSIRFYSIEEDEDGIRFLYNFNTIPSKSTILDTLQVHNKEYLYPSEFEIWVAKIDEIAEKIERAEKSLADNIADARQDLDNIVNSTMQEISNVLEQTKQQLEFAKEQVNVANERVDFVVDFTSEKAVAIEEQVVIASRHASDATHYSALSENYSKIASDYAVEAKQSRNESEEFSKSSEDYAIQSQSYAIGGTAFRDDESVDNAKYYYEQSKSIADNLGV